MSFNFPPDSSCQSYLTYDLSLGLDCADTGFSNLGNCSCPVTQNMINFLNLTAGFDNYFQAYCLNPASDDSCSFGYCPNGDIAGPLVRISAYVTNFCLSILVFYAPERVEEPFWSQVLTIYSTLITCAISIAQSSLTRFHAIVATIIVGSPLSLYLALYAAISIWSHNHRLARFLGKGRIIPRVLMMLAVVMWLVLLIYILAPQNVPQFSQPSCEDRNRIVQNIYRLPVLIVVVSFSELPWFAVVLTLPVFLAVSGWIIVLFLRRKSIWPADEKWSPNVIRVWSITGKNYPFLHFMTCVLVPFMYWICIIEFACVFTPDTWDHISLSFGQVLALFVALPPVISVLQLFPNLVQWFKHLAWVRRLRGRPSRSHHGTHFRAVLVTDISPEREREEDLKGFGETTELPQVLDISRDSSQTKAEEAPA